MISISLTFMFLYTNLFLLGYSLLDYLKFIFTKVEVLCIFLGIFLIIKVYKER